MAIDGGKQPRRQHGAYTGTHHQKGYRHCQNRQHTERRDAAAAGDDPHHHGEDHQPNDIIGHRRSEHGAGFAGGQRSKVTKHPGGDTNAGGGKGSTEEQRLIGGEIEQLSHCETGRKWHSDSDDSHGH